MDFIKFETEFMFFFSGFKFSLVLQNLLLKDDISISLILSSRAFFLSFCLPFFLPFLPSFLLSLTFFSLLVSIWKKKQSLNMEYVNNVISFQE
jgi:hypothetical protein